jgi:hypothetical protein
VVDAGSVKPEVEVRIVEARADPSAAFVRLRLRA